MINPQRTPEIDITLLENPSAINCSFGRNIKDAYPIKKEFDDFSGFQNFVLTNRAPIKGLLYVCAAMSDGHRCKDSAMPTRYIAFDFDGMPGMEAFNNLRLFLAQFSGFGYTTSKHTEQTPRARAVLEASRNMTYAERLRISMSIEQRIAEQIAGIVFDKSVYNSYQPIFNPLVGSIDFEFMGDVIDVDYMLQSAPDYVDDTPTQRKNLEAALDSDPILSVLGEKGMVKKDMGKGRFAVVCPCATEHSSESNETSTVYTLPNFGGFTFGNFTCLHEHCSQRPQAQFVAALGLDFGQARAKQAEIPNVDHSEFVKRAKEKKEAQDKQVKQDQADPEKWIDPIDVFAETAVPKISRDMLPEAIAEYAFDCGDLIGVDPAMIAMPAIVACAAALHDGVTIQPKRHEKGWTESARLWCALVGAPSVKKSPAIKRGSKELRKIDMRLHADSDKQAAKHEQDVEAWEQLKKDAKKTNHAIPNRPEKPARKRMVVEDITVEALSEILKDNDRGVLGIMDELSGFFGAMDAYSGSKAASKDRAHWLESYNGGGRIVDRIGRGSINIPNWSVSMIGGIQPDAIKRIAKNMVDDGLMQRFMVVIGGNGQEYDRPENTQAHDAFQTLVRALFAIAPSESAVTLSEEAHIERIALNELTELMIEAASVSNAMKSHLGKWSGLFARLLLVYHAIECVKSGQYPTAVQVSGETAKRVKTLMTKFLLPHSLAYYNDILGGGMDHEHVRNIAGLLLANPAQAVTLSSIMAGYKPWRSLDNYAKQRILDALEEFGWLQSQHLKQLTFRRGAAMWIVNPKIYTAFPERIKQEKLRRAEITERLKAVTKGCEIV